jgi:hypothetical protein
MDLPPSCGSIGRRECRPLIQGNLECAVQQANSRKSRPICRYCCVRQQSGAVMALGCNGIGQRSKKPAAAPSAAAGDVD